MTDRLVGQIRALIEEWNISGDKGALAPLPGLFTELDSLLIQGAMPPVDWMPQIGG